MKKLLLLGVGSALMFTMGGVGPAQADNGPHMSGAVTTAGTVTITNAAGRCASCHRAHTAQGEYLLLQAQPALCYTCHDGTGAGTNVKSGQRAGTTTALRGGGFETAAIDSGGARRTWALDATGKLVSSNATIPTLTTPAPVTSRHQIDGTTQGTIWGNGVNNSGLGKTGVTLECGSCHDPHGNGNYRILKPVPNDAGTKKVDAVTTAVVGVPDNPATAANEYVKAVSITAGVAEVLVAPVNVPDATAYGYTTTNYWATGDANVPLGVSATATAMTGAKKTADLATDGYIQNIAAWCTTCHTRYLAPTGSYKTPSGDDTFKYRHRSDANYKQNAANCITCHVSHGSNAVMNGDAATVTEPGGTTAPEMKNLVANVLTSAGPDSRLLRVNNRGTCIMCHNV